jgi:predicted Zn-dependent protease
MRLVAFFLLAVLASAAHAQLPGIFGDVLRNVQRPATAPQQAAPAAPGLLSDTSLDEEIQIGRRLAGNLLGAAPLVRDDSLQRYVNRVGRWVATQSERPQLKWYFGVLETADLNAFALPGGYVFITRGLLELMSDEAELAGVLGHEIAHVVLQHHLKVLKQSQAVNVVGNLFAQQKGNDLVAQALIGKGAEALTRGLDKGAEFDADLAGIVLATRAGYTPYGLPGVLRKIASRNPREASLTLLFKTHPLPQERLERLGDAMGASFDRYAEGRALRERFAKRE